jgi:hypothetical protein
MFVKLYGDGMNPGQGSNIRGIPIDRMSFLQADNTMKTFAKESGGAFYPITFEGEIGNALGSINAMLRSQYSLGFNPGEERDGKSHKIVVKVDVDGDGTYDDKAFAVRRARFTTLRNRKPPQPEKLAGSSKSVKSGRGAKGEPFGLLFYRIASAPALSSWSLPLALALCALLSCLTHSPRVK